MKKFLSVLLAAAMTAALFTACGSNSSAAASSATSSKTYKVGILQYMQHTSLDEISAAIIAELQKKADANGVKVEVELENAQGDQTNINTISKQFVSDKVNLVIAIATPAAQGAAAALEDTGIPLIFSAVTDPVAAQLVASTENPGGSITGTSDAIPVGNIFDLAKKLTPDVKSFGLMYCTSEVNSVTVIKEAKEYLEKNGLTYTESAVTTGSDVQSAAQILLGKVDAIFVPIDNTVASAMSVLANEAIKAKKPVYVAADSMVKDGALASVGCNYTGLGTQTADMAFNALTGADVSKMPVEVIKETNVVLNQSTAKAIGLDMEKLPANIEFHLVGANG